MDFAEPNDEPTICRGAYMEPVGGIGKAEKSVGVCHAPDADWGLEEADGRATPVWRYDSGKCEQNEIWLFAHFLEKLNDGFGTYERIFKNVKISFKITQ